MRTIPFSFSLLCKSFTKQGRHSFKILTVVMTVSSQVFHSIATPSMEEVFSPYIMRIKRIPMFVNCYIKWLKTFYKILRSDICRRCNWKLDTWWYREFYLGTKNIKKLEPYLYKIAVNISAFHIICIIWNDGFYIWE